MVGVTVLLLVAVWFALARPSGHPSARPSASGSPASSSPLGSISPSAVRTIAHVRVRGRASIFQAWPGPSGTLCVQLEGGITCDFLLGPGQAVQVSFARWFYPDSTGYNFAMFVTGAISSEVASVRVSFGAGRWVNATILTPPAELGFPSRLYYMEERTGFQSLNRSLPVVALDARGHEIGRTSYLVQGG